MLVAITDRRACASAFTAAQQAIQAECALEENENDQCCGEQHDRQCSSESPVQRAIDVVGDQHRDHLLSRTAHQRRRDVVADGAHEDDRATGDDTRHRQRQDDAPPDRRGASAKTLCRLDQRTVNRAEGRIKR